MSKSIKRAGLFSSTLIVIGSIIGIGIFIKNASIFSLNNGNSVAILCAWIIGAIIAILKGYSFLEISSIKTKGEDKGMVLWMDKLVGKSSKRITQMFLIVLYLGVLCPIIVGYSLNFFMMFLQRPLTKEALYITMFAVPAFFTIMKLISDKLPNKLNIVITICKIIPLLLTAFIGMFLIKNGGGLGNTMFITHTPQSQNLAVGILISLPSILFSFDAFLNVASINNNEDKNVSRSIIIGMILVAIFYVLITISQININRGYVSTTYDEVYDKFGNKSFQDLPTITGNMAYEGLINNTLGTTANRIFILIVAISGFGVINIIMMAGSSLVAVSSPFKTNRSSTLAFLLIVFITAGTLVGIETYEIHNRSSVVTFGYMNGDAIDAMSNIPVIFAFSFYTIILIAALANRKTNKVKVTKRKYFVPAAIISITMTMVIIGTFIGYSIIYQSIVDYEANKILVDATICYSIATLFLFCIAILVHKLDK